MCGIAGYVSFEEGAAPEATLARMTEAIRHRGPDASGTYHDAQAWLGHRRLSIIDLATGGQPMCNESGDLWIVYNGEIFNHAGLRGELEKAGHRYKTRSDTETILHVYEEYGSDCLARFRGMFAFAIWDRKREQLFCARDRLGKKPFYYYWDGRLFVFASEIKALLEHPAITAGLEEELLAEHLAFGYSSDDRTLFRGIRKLMPGCRLTLTAAGPAIDCYWEIPRRPETGRETDWPDEAWIQECRRRLEETVCMRLMSDVPLGMFLSGGVDSSAIAALMKRLTNGPVKSYAVGYREDEHSELSYAARVSRAIGTEHREVIIGREEFFDVLPKLIWHEDEPIVWPSSVSLYYVSKLASEEVKVVLTGEGSDEMFGGYSRYRYFLLNQQWMRLYGLAPRIAREWLRRRIADSRWLEGSLRRRLQHSFLGREASVDSLYLDNFYSAFSREQQEDLLLEPGRFVDTAYAPFFQYWNASAGRPLLERMLYADQKTYLVELLMKQDQMSMACSIESRVPFLDHEFFEFSTRVPPRLKLKGSTGKYILKRAVEDLLPQEIIYRKKMGFPTPVREWLRHSDADALLRLLLARDGLLAAYVQRGHLERLLEEHKKGLRDATDGLWRLLNLQLWGEIFLNGKRDLVQEGLMTRQAGHAA
jgi:asparagine synthase (glutamine-hydrolysing)